MKSLVYSGESSTGNTGNLLLKEVNHFSPG